MTQEEKWQPHSTRKLVNNDGDEDDNNTDCSNNNNNDNDNGNDNDTNNNNNNNDNDNYINNGKKIAQITTPTTIKIIYSICLL